MHGFLYLINLLLLIFPKYRQRQFLQLRFSGHHVFCQWHFLLYNLMHFSGDIGHFFFQRHMLISKFAVQRTAHRMFYFHTQPFIMHPVNGIGQKQNQRSLIRLESIFRMDGPPPDLTGIRYFPPHPKQFSIIFCQYLISSQIQGISEHSKGTSPGNSDSCTL